MKIRERQQGDIDILEVNGRIRIGEGDIELRRAVREVVERGARKIVLNMRGVRSIDSSGVGELIAAYTSAVHQGAKVKLAELSPKVSSVLQLTQLVGILDMYDTEDAAVQSFRS